MKKLVFTAAVAAMFATSCSNKTEQSSIPTIQPGSTTTDTSAPASAPVEAPAAALKTGNDITVNAGDDMKYDTSEIRVKAGEKVKITLKHTGKMSKDAMGHNFIILAQNTPLDAFANTAMAAKDTDYIPASESKNIIAHTKLLAGGESDTIEFDAPAKGTYDFLCSFPGHYGVMKGKFIVE